MADATGLLIQALMNQKEEYNPWQTAGVSIASQKTPIMPHEGFWRNFLASAAPQAIGGAIMAYGNREAKNDQAALATKLQQAFTTNDPYSALSGTNMQNMAPIIDLVKQQRDQVALTDQATPEEIATVQSALSQMGKNIQIPKGTSREALNGIIAGVKLEASQKPKGEDQMNPFVEEQVRQAYGVPSDAPPITQRDARRLHETFRPIPDKDAKQFGSTKSFIDTVKRLKGLSTQFDDGFLSGVFRDFKAGNVPYLGDALADPDSPEYKFYAELNRLQKMLAGELEPGGKLSNQDYEILKGLVRGVSLYDKRKTIEDRLNNLQDYAVKVNHNMFNSLKDAGFNMRDLTPATFDNVAESPPQDPQAPSPLDLRDPQQYNQYKEQLKAKMRQGR